MITLPHHISLNPPVILSALVVVATIAKLGGKIRKKFLAAHQSSPLPKSLPPPRPYTISDEAIDKPSYVSPIDAEIQNQLQTLQHMAANPSSISQDELIQLHTNFPRAQKYFEVAKSRSGDGDILIRKPTIDIPPGIALTEEIAESEAGCRPEAFLYIVATRVLMKHSLSSCL